MYDSSEHNVIVFNRQFCPNFVTVYKKPETISAYRWFISSGSRLSFSCKLYKMLSVCVDVCLDVNQGGTNRNRCTWRLVILHAQTY